MLAGRLRLAPECEHGSETSYLDDTFGEMLDDTEELDRQAVSRPAATLRLFLSAPFETWTTADPDALSRYVDDDNAPRVIEIV